MIAKKLNFQMFVLWFCLCTAMAESDEEHLAMVRLQTRLDYLMAEYHDLKNLVVSCKCLISVCDVRTRQTSFSVIYNQQYTLWSLLYLDEKASCSFLANKIVGKLPNDFAC